MQGRRSGALALDRFDSGAVRATSDVRLELPTFAKGNFKIDGGIKMEWEKFKIMNQKEYYCINNSNREITDIDCPKCGKKIYVRTDIVLTSYPPQRQYECDCGWVGYN